MRLPPVFKIGKGGNGKGKTDLSSCDVTNYKDINDMSRMTAQNLISFICVFVFSFRFFVSFA